MTSHKGRLLAVLLVAPFMAQADATIANVATPAIRSDLGAGGAALQLVIGGYLIAFAVLLITGARLGRSHGHRRAFVLGAGVFTGASLVCGLAPSPAVLVAARVGQGAGAALMFPQTLTGIQLSFAGEERARAIGLYAIALSCGAVTGQILGGALVYAVGWRAIFLVNVPIGVAVIAAALRILPAGGREERRVDVAGVAALSAALLLVVLPLALGRAEGWPDWTWVCLAAAVPAFALFLAVERRARTAPLVDVRLVARAPVAWALVTLMLATGTYFALLFTLAQYLQRGLGHSAFVSGLTLVPWVAAFGLAGQLVHRAPRLTPAVGCLLLALAYAALSALLFSGRHPEGLLVLLLGAGGLGLGIQFSALLRRLTGAVGPEHASDISGVSTTTSQIGGALGVAGFGTLYLSLPGATHAFAVTTAGFAAVALLAAASARLSTSLGDRCSMP